MTEQAAGIAILRITDDVPRILCLRIYGSFDLPKGRVEEGESPFDAAVRETREEAGLTDVRFPWGMESVTVRKSGKHQKSVTVFVGVTDQEPTLSRNPESGQYEHHGVTWLTLDDAEQGLHRYLRPIVPWIRKQLSEERLRELIRSV